MTNEVKEKLVAIFKKETGRDIAEKDFDKNLRKEAYLDSMQFVCICARVEKALNIELPISVIAANTFNQFLSIAKKAVGKKFRESK